jgi:dienelactone hydrolase
MSVFDRALFACLRASHAAGLTRFVLSSTLWATACAEASPDQPPDSLAAAPDESVLDVVSDGAQALRGESTASTAEPNFAVGTQLINVTSREGRSLPVQLWYPAVEAARAEADRGRPLVDIEPPGAHRDVLAELVRTAPSPSTNKTLHAADAPDVVATPEALPLLVFSHCNDCVRFSSFTVAEHLARLGFVVAAPDHVGNTLYENLEGTSVGLDAAFLATRVADVTAVLDTLLDDAASGVPEGLRGRLDAERVGAFGHSFGGLTSGAMEKDARVRAIAALAIPVGMSGIMHDLEMRYPDVTAMTKPLLLIKADEDIGLLNVMLDDNFALYRGTAWRVTIENTAHYSVSDLCALYDFFDFGCGTGLRQTVPLMPLTYLDSDVARELTARHVGAFFQQELLGVGKGPAGMPKHERVSVELRTGP